MRKKKIVIFLPVMMEPSTGNLNLLD